MKRIPFAASIGSALIAASLMLAGPAAARSGGHDNPGPSAPGPSASVRSASPTSLVNFAPVGDRELERKQGLSNGVIMKLPPHSRVINSEGGYAGSGGGQA